MTLMNLYFFANPKHTVQCDQCALIPKWMTLKSQFFWVNQKHTVQPVSDSQMNDSSANELALMSQFFLVKENIQHDWCSLIIQWMKYSATSVVWFSNKLILCINPFLVNLKHTVRPVQSDSRINDSFANELAWMIKFFFFFF